MATDLMTGCCSAIILAEADRSPVEEERATLGLCCCDLFTLESCRSLVFLFASLIVVIKKGSEKVVELGGRF